MHRTKLLAAVALLAIAAPAAAQNMNMDPTKEVKGSGVLPTNWMLRFDPPRRPTTPVPPKTAIVFEPMASGFHIQSGPAAIYYNTKDTGKGQYAISATFAQQKTMAHEVFGLFIGGGNLQDSTQHYIYFVVRPSDGMAMISQRTSNAAPKAVRPYFASAAINKDDPKDGHATNALTIHVAKDTIHFVANGKLVAGVAKSEFAVGTDGQAGIRVNHNMDLMITGYSVK
jgi:hypothetical protein